MGWGPIQGMDTIPREIARDFAPLFERHLPGWDVNGATNFQAGGSTQRVASQLKLPMHSGSNKMNKIETATI